jgi:hypothetical protein
LFEIGGKSLEDRLKELYKMKGYLESLDSDVKLVIPAFDVLRLVDELIRYAES